MTSNNRPLLPHQFGPLQGVRILSTGHLIAQPFAPLSGAERPHRVGGRTVEAKGQGHWGVPRISATPGEIWRGSVPIGYDNELVYGNLLGIDGTRLFALEEKGVI